MRVIKSYHFGIGTKIPFSEYPEIVHQFLANQGLTYRKFLYYFGELIFMKTHEEALATGSCAKALKDCPGLGEIRFFDGADYGMYPQLYLSNIDKETDCTEADILPHMKKIYKRYGFFESNLYYCDIDFFGSPIPCQRDLSWAQKRAEHFERPFEPTLRLADQLYGSGIRLHRYSTGRNYLGLSFDILHNGKIYDPTPYADAMKALLPNIQPRIGMEIYLSDTEKKVIASWDHQIAPALERARGFFAARAPGKDRQNTFVCRYTLAPKLKKLAKQYGFDYRYDGFGVYLLDKRTPRGHVLRLCVDSGPSRGDTTYHVNFQGIGFSHTLCNSMQTPTNQVESDACAERMLSIISEFEKNFVSELDTFYEETPEWFVPSAWY